VIDRQEYGVQWNRALDNGGTILSDEVKIRLDFEVNLQKEEMEGEEAAE